MEDHVNYRHMLLQRVIQTLKNHYFSVASCEMYAIFFLQ